jgi:hypothetical protein
VIGAGRTLLPDGVEGEGLQAKEKVLCLPQGAGNYDVCSIYRTATLTWFSLPLWLCSLLIGEEIEEHTHAPSPIQ